MEQVDVIIIGAGVVGLAVAAALTEKFPDRDIVVLERHDKFGQDTSSRNSEVIHAGMYYPTGSLKAKLCVEGNRLLYEFCAAHGVPHQRLGKLIIARNDGEIPLIAEILKQGQANGVEGLTLLDKDEVAKLEPHITAVAAVYSPATGIIDSHRLMARLEQQAVQGGVMLAYRNRVVRIEREDSGYNVTFMGPDGQEDALACRWLVNCAGLYADQVAAMAGIDVAAAGYKIYPVKGEYFSLPISKSKLLSHLVYPPPLKALKGLGTHVTKSLDGRARLGPNAFYIDGREDYNVDETHRDEFYRAAKSYLPFLTPDDLQPDMAGIRPKIQAPDAPVADFVVRHEADRGLPGFINMVGIESPGLTCCLSLARMVQDMIEE